MLLIHHLEQLDEPCRDGVCMTLGVFDALHLGHQWLIRRAREEALRRGVKSMVFTFERHPLYVLAPAYAPPAITQPKRKGQLIEALGVDICLKLRFTPEIAAIAPEAFIEEVLVGRCRVRHVVCGTNFSFGRGGRGNPALLKTSGERLGFDVEIAQPLMEGHSPISSTRVRNDLIDGHVETAQKLLGRRYRFAARVVEGDRRGRTLGYPTANLEPDPTQLIPADGVYAVFAYVGGERCGGMMNIGSRPTFAGAGRSLEVHLFDFSRDIFGETIEVEFVRRVRDEKKFASVDELVAQLKSDERTCREILDKATK